MLKPWFLQPKVRIILPERAPDDSEFGRGLLPDDLVAGLPWVSEFDPFDPAEQSRLRLILRVSNVKGQTFLIRSAVDVEGKPLATFASFPTSDEVSAAVAEPYGRGPYNVWGTKPRPQLLRTYFVQGPVRRHSGESREQDRIADLTTEIKADLMEMAIERLQDHPEVFDSLALGLLCKELDVPVPDMPDFEAEVLSEAMRDPEYREQEAKRVLESRRAEAERIAEFQKLDDLLAYLKKAKRTVELMGYTQDVKPNASAGLDDLAKILFADGALRDIVEAFKNVRHPRNTSQARQASPVGEPPHAEEQPKAQNGAHDSQVAEHLPPNRPPQSPAPQEPRVREKPGVADRQRSVGVPAEMLGLLGLGGDNTFDDRRLV